MRTVVLAVFAALMAIPNALGAQTFTLETSWASPGAQNLDSDGSNVWVVNTDASHVTGYDANGAEIASWNTNVPDPNLVFRRGIGVDGAGFVYVMAATRENSALKDSRVWKFQSDGSPLGSQPFDFPPSLGFAVDAAGNVYGGDDSFDDQIALMALSPDGTKFLSNRDSDDYSLYGEGPGYHMVPGDPKCGGPSGRDQSCFNAFAVAATESRLYVAAYWCDAQSNCGTAIHAYGPNSTSLGVIPSDGAPASGADGTVYVLRPGGTIEKWVPSGETPASRASWGTVKAHWR